MGIALGIILLVIEATVFGTIFYVVFRMWRWLLRTKNPFPGLSPWRAFWIWRFTGHHHHGEHEDHELF